MTVRTGLDVQLHPEWGGSFWGMAANDFDSDGWPDLYVSVRQDRNRLFLSDGQGGFVEETSSETEGSPEEDSLGVAVGDIDNDGDLDLLSGEHCYVLVNDGEGAFSDSTARSAGSSGYLSFADYDRDGFLDYLTGSPGIDGGGLMRNSRLDADNHWLAVELAGTRSNRRGVGARVVASTGMGNQTREIRAGLGHTQDEMVAHCGLGSRVGVDRLEVLWPSGQIDVLTDIPADQRIRIVEGQDTYHRVESTVWITPPPAALIARTTTVIDALLRPALFREPG